MSQTQNSTCIRETVHQENIDMPHLVLSSGPYDDDGKDTGSGEE